MPRNAGFLRLTEGLHSTVSTLIM